MLPLSTERMRVEGEVEGGEGEGEGREEGKMRRGGGELGRYLSFYRFLPTDLILEGRIE